MNKAVFLDRDGVINRKLEDDYVKIWEDFHFLQGVKEAVRILNEKGYLVIVVTNQRGIARGLMTESDLEGIHRRMREEFQKYRAHIDDIFYCPHDISDNCACRKPQAGMLIEAQEKWDIDFSQSYIIGDSQSDIEAGQRVGCRGILTTKLIKVMKHL